MRLNLLVTMVSLLFGSLGAWAQSDKGGVGNGGGVHWCPGKAPEMYDLYEGKRRFKLKIEDDGSSYEEIIKRSLRKLENATLANEIQNEIDYLETEGFSFETSLKLKLVPDANILMTDENCEYRQLANWDDETGTVFIKNEYYEQMDDFNRAALTLHESIYSVLRKRLNASNSDRSRKLVAQLMSSSFNREKSLLGIEKAKDTKTNARPEGIDVLETKDGVVVNVYVANMKIPEVLKGNAKVRFSVPGIDEAFFFSGIYEDETRDLLYQSLSGKIKVEDYPLRDNKLKIHTYGPLLLEAKEMNVVIEVDVFSDTEKKTFSFVQKMNFSSDRNQNKLSLKFNFYQNSEI